MRGGDELDEIAPRGRLAAGKMHLQHAERGGFAEHALPGRGVELVGAAVERERDWSNRGSRAGSDA